MYKTKESTYKGHTIFTIDEEGNKYSVISFGLKKAKAILANIDKIQEFVQKNDTSNTNLVLTKEEIEAIMKMGR